MKVLSSLPSCPPIKHASQSIHQIQIPSHTPNSSFTIRNQTLGKFSFSRNDLFWNGQHLESKWFSSVKHNAELKRSMFCKTIKKMSLNHLNGLNVQKKYQYTISFWSKKELFKKVYSFRRLVSLKHQTNDMFMAVRFIMTIFRSFQIKNCLFFNGRKLQAYIKSPNFLEASCVNVLTLENSQWKSWTRFSWSFHFSANPVEE